MNAEQKQAINKQLIIDYQTVFDNEYGKRILADLELEFGLYDTASGYVRRRISDGKTFVSQIDPYATLFNDGARGVILYIKERVGANVDKEVQETAESEVEDAADEKGT